MNNEQKRTASRRRSPARKPGNRSAQSKDSKTHKKRNSRGRRPGRHNKRRRSMTSPALKHRIASNTNDKKSSIPPLTDDDTVRIIPLGGVEEVGKNMTVVETKDDILIFDAGFQFISDESDAPGVNYILPSTQYLEENKDKIRGLIITHGHLDHIGGIPFIIERIGNPPIYTRYLTSLMI
jgi:Predicted hydrolase of the metallo-beta-lactamase superfamily